MCKMKHHREYCAYLKEDDKYRIMSIQIHQTLQDNGASNRRVKAWGTHKVHASSNTIPTSKFVIH